MYSNIMGNSIFVGRESELKQLQSIFREASSGLGKLVLIQGNPGIGKSGLVREFLRPFENQSDVIYAIAECNDKEGLNSYAPFKDLLLKLNTSAVTGNKESRAQMFGKLKRFISEAGTEWIGMIPVVGSVAQAGIETVKAYQSTYGETKDNKIQSEEDIYRIFENEFRRLAKEKTLIIFIDDLQWADASSLNPLFTLGRSIRECPFKIMIIGTFRQFDIEEGRYRISENGENIKVRHPLSDKLSELRNYTKQESHIKRVDQWFLEIAMKPFSDKEVEQLINTKFPKNNFQASLYPEICKLTNGHPLFLVEILEYLLKNGNIKMQLDGSYSIGQMNLANLPVSVQAIINEKVERLDDELKKILSYASVSGEEFAVPIIEKVLKIDELDLLGYLEQLSKKHGLLAANEPVHVKDMLFELYRFTQTLVHKYIYENLDGARRRALHRKMAEIMKNLYGDEIEVNKELKDKYNLHTQIGQGLIDGITHQLTDLKSQSNNQESLSMTSYIDAAKSELSAAAESFRQFAANECLDRINKSLGLLSALKNKDTETESIRFDGYALRNKTQQWQGHYSEAYSTAQEMLKKAIYLGNNEHIALSNKALGKAVHFLGRYDEAIVYLYKALDIYKEAGNQEMLAECLNDIAFAKEMQSLYDEAIHLLQESLEICKKIDHRYKTGETIFSLAANHRKKGEYKTALKLYLQALEIFESLGEQKQIGLTYNSMGLNYHATGELQKAMEYIRKALTISEQQNDRVNIGNRLSNIGLTYELMGNSEGSLEYYCKALEIDSSLDDKPKMAISYNNIGLVHANIRQFEKAYEYFNKSIIINKMLNDRSGLSFSYSSMGHAMYGDNKIDESIEYLKMAIEIDQESGDKVSLGGNYNGLGNAYYSEQDYSNANDFYHKALEIYENIQDSFSIALIYNNLANISYAREENEEALEHYQKALEIYENSEDLLNIALLKGNLGNTYNRLKEYPKAKKSFQRSAEIYRNLKQDWDLAKQLQNLGMCYYNMEYYDESIASFEQSNEIFSDLEEDVQLGFNYRDIADAFKKKGDIDEAIKNYDIAIQKFLEANDDYQAAQVWLNMAWMFEDESDRENSIPCFEEALNLMIGLKESYNVINIHCQLGTCYKSIQDYQKAENHYLETIAFATEVKEEWSIAKAQKGLAMVHSEKGEYDQAKQLFISAIDHHEFFDDKYELADTYYELANCFWTSPDYDQYVEEAIGYFSKAFDIFTDIQDDFNRGYCLYSLGAIYNALGQFKTACTHLQRSKELVLSTYPDYDIAFINDQLGMALSNMPSNYDKPGAI
jgi:tetratricopeptide (TPR) repeat protein